MSIKRCYFLHLCNISVSFFLNTAPIRLRCINWDQQLQSWRNRTQAWDLDEKRLDETNRHSFIGNNWNNGGFFNNRSSWRPFVSKKRASGTGFLKTSVDQVWSLGFDFQTIQSTLTIQEALLLNFAFAFAWQQLFPFSLILIQKRRFESKWTAAQLLL